ncbi:hypothetical protein Rctr16k_07 [Virus Rctr16k]|nr:hypothetical protein Rctr16k_07 [Virus Rctr16k]
MAKKQHSPRTASETKTARRSARTDEPKASPEVLPLNRYFPTVCDLVSELQAESRRASKALAYWTADHDAVQMRELLASARASMEVAAELYRRAGELDVINRAGVTAFADEVQS